MGSKLLWSILFFSLFLVACASENSSSLSQGETQVLTGNQDDTAGAEPLPENVLQTKLAIEGMTCGGCAEGVRSQLESVDGVITADVSWTKGFAIVEYDADKTDAESIAKASTVYPAVVVD